MELGKIEPTTIDEKRVHEFTDVLKMNSDTRQVRFIRDAKPKQHFVGWECPACGVGVRGDVEVCPNCVKNKTEFKVKGSSEEAGLKTLLTELRRKGIDGS